MRSPWAKGPKVVWAAEAWVQVKDEGDHEKRHSFRADRTPRPCLGRAGAKRGLVGPAPARLAGRRLGLPSPSSLCHCGVLEARGFAGSRSPEAVLGEGG